MSEAKTPAAAAGDKAPVAAAPVATPVVAPAQPVVTTVDVPLGSRLYEVMFVVDAGHGRENQGKLLTELKDLVEKSGGTWVNGDKWEERRLAYNIKKRKRGLYILAHVVSSTQSIAKLDRNIQISDLVIRALITVDEDGLSLAPPVRVMDDDDDGGPGGERRFFGGDRGGPRRGGFRDHGDRGGDRGDRGDRPPRSRDRS
jgi:small subunit ribosomal protein S6